MSLASGSVRKWSWGPESLVDWISFSSLKFENKSLSESMQVTDLSLVRICIQSFYLKCAVLEIMIIWFLFL